MGDPSTAGEAAGASSTAFGMYARYCALGLCVLVPVLFTQSTLNMFDLPKFALLWVLTVVGFALSQAWYTRDGLRTPRTPATTMALLIVAVTALSAAVSPYRTVAVAGLYNRYGGLVTQILFFLLFVLIVRLQLGRPDTSDRIALALGVGAGLSAGYVLIQAFGADPMQWSELGEPTFDRPHGTLGNPNFSGAFLGAALPICLYLAVGSGSRRGRAAWLAVAALSCLAIWETETRGGMVAGAVGGATALLFLRKELLRGWRNSNPALRVAAIAAMVLALSFGSILAIGEIRRSSEGAVTPAEGVFRSRSLELRVGWWRSAAAILADHPIVGTGPNTYYVANLPYRHLIPADKRDLLTVDAPHNVFLERGAATGILGLGAYLALVGTIGVYAYRRSNSVTGRDRLRLAAFAGLLAGYLAQGFFSLDVPGLAFTGWIALSVLASTTDPRLLAAGLPGRRARGKAGKLVIPAMLGAALVAALVGARAFAADARSRLAFEAGSAELALARANEAIRLNPWEGEYQFQKAEILKRLGAGSDDPATTDSYLRAGAEAYRRALRLRPGYVWWYGRLAGMYTDAGSKLRDPRYFELADQAWESALALDPLNYLAHFRRSENLRIWARVTGDPGIRGRQVSELQASLSLHRYHTRSWIRLAAAYRALGEPQQAEAALREHFGRVPSGEELDSYFTAESPEPSGPDTTKGFQPMVLVLTLGLMAVAIALAQLDPSGLLGDGPPSSMDDPPPEFAKLVVVLAAVTLAMAAPSLGPPFLGKWQPGELGEFAAHMLAGGLLVLLGVRWEGREQRSRYLAVGLVGATLTALHVIYPTLGFHPGWTRALAHLGPGLAALALAAWALRSRHRRLPSSSSS